MAAPVIPILKKVAGAVLSNKKGRKVVFYILAIALMIVLLPVILIELILRGELEISELDTEVATSNMTVLIEEPLREKGLSEQRIGEAKLFYFILLSDQDAGSEKAEKVAECYANNENDEALVTALNRVFGTDLTVDQYTALVGETRKKYEEYGGTSNEEESEKGNPASSAEG